MQVESQLDRDLLSQVLSHTNIVYANRENPDSVSISAISGTTDPKEAWVRLHKDAFDRIIEMYISGKIDESELEGLLDLTLNIHGDPYGVFDF